MNESQIIAWLKTYVYAAPEVQLEMISGMAQRFGRLHKRVVELEEALAVSDERLARIVDKENERRITELETTLSKSRADNSKLLEDHGVALAQVAELETEATRLRKLVYLAHDTDCTCEICVAMPHEPIICCICNKPIEGDDLDDRFWLHAKGCKFSETGECDCDLECHAECYTGHEDEYAPPFDEDDE